MTEYWVSKKQYWCKYCNIWIRDDAPSRRHHETGLKHQGNKERFVRDLYKSGDKAKRDAAAEAIEMARIEASAAAAHAKDVGGTYAGRPSVLATISAAKAAASSSRLRPSEKRDKWANYSTAQQLGFDDEETAKSSYEIEQELKGRAGEVGAWEEVGYEPQGYSTPPIRGPGEGDGEEGQGVGGREGPQEGPGGGEGGYQDDTGEAGAGPSGKRKLGEYGVRDEEDHEDWKFSHRDKKPARLDPYDEDDWDPKTAFKKLKRKDGGGSAVPIKEEGQDFKREEWTGRLELVQDAGVKGKGKDTGSGTGNGGLTYVPNGVQGDEEVKPEVDETKPDLASMALPSDKTGASERAADADAVANDVKPVADAPVAGGGLFKKRRPPPSGRKKD
ncbi:hypothetical protein EHS25_010026 [Saitozyma podzolica]|uniref:Matrin-type domain-containing protein n=1 Tax=Saitozyma podzolica TaxID=1890683 RepID=A0A427YIF1_9TREE|nr:hypothetical protein EHS25_010026 [Saitozyma podzolica]